MATELDLDLLAAAIRAKRGSTGVRAAARDADVSAATLSRVENGKVPDLDTFLKLCHWLGMSASDFVAGDAAADEISLGSPEAIEVHLRASKTLSPETAAALSRVIRLAYEAADRGDFDGEDGG